MSAPPVATSRRGLLILFGALRGSGGGDDGGLVSPAAESLQAFG